MSSSTVLVKNIKIRPTNTTNSSTFRYEPKTLQQIQEEKTQRIVQIRKDFNQRQSQNIKDLKSHFYIILPGNASYLVKNCMQHRINWKEPFSVTTSLYNFKWQQISYGIDFASLSKFSSFKQIVMFAKRLLGDKSQYNSIIIILRMHLEGYSHFVNHVIKDKFKRYLSIK